MKIRITGTGIYGKSGEIEVGTELTVQSEPKGWEGRYQVIEGDAAGKTEVINRDELKKQADELSIEYARNVSNEKLQELIDAKLAE